MVISKQYRAPHLYELAFAFPPQGRWRAHAFGAILKELGQLDKSRRDFLDIGCGAGVLSKMIALKNPRSNIKAIDSSSYMVEYARKFHGHPSLDYVAQSFWDETGTYDMVTAAYCWHFFPLRSAAEKLKSILRPKACALIVATRETPLTRIHRRLFHIFSNETLSLYSPEELCESLEEKGFCVEWRGVDRSEGSYLVVARLP